ncbi:putative DNA-directed RNA polymerase III subunit F [Tripterygium wilfordii]|uniref:Putative DNA-directed RNA polymerase III subunit F n=1 Tax=Tripterygium wilfordii TaxID=458696 RepID=A0A7J7D3L8_TRIWF|nr:DNA-directed RNA polymerase III subunit RPC6-like [Tripterygium wilfordii]KAF5740921.1 putative DNA-directed RNA polymerase III subunit F [Tripterygium wilfordii]
MSRSQGPLAIKRKRPDSSSPANALTEHELIVLKVIETKEDMGIWLRDLKREAHIPDNAVTKALKSLQAKNLIKEVKTVQNRGRKHYMASQFEPSKEITGGDWYAGGSLDVHFIKCLKELCIKFIGQMKLATMEGVTNRIRDTGAFEVELTNQQIEDILRALVLDNEIMEVRSNGLGDFANIPVGKVCYKLTSKRRAAVEPKIGAFASIPCGVCTQISLCTPGGVISPETCVYYKEWLDF